MTKFDIHSWEDIITPNKFAPLSNDWIHPRIANKELKLAEAKKLTEKTTAAYLDQNEELLRRGQRW